MTKSALRGLKPWSAYIRDADYTLFSQSNRLKRLIETVIEFTPSHGKVLEVGFGSGLTLILLQDLTVKVYGVELDRQLLLRTHSRTSQLRLLRCDARKLPFKDKIFDTVYHQGFLEHFDNTTITTLLREQKRVALTVIFDVPTNRFSRKRLSRPRGDERFLNFSSWLKLISLSGLEVIYIYGRDLVWYSHLLPGALLYCFDFLFGQSVGFVCKPAGSLGVGSRKFSKLGIALKRLKQGRYLARY